MTTLRLLPAALLAALTLGACAADDRSADVAVVTSDTTAAVGGASGAARAVAVLTPTDTTASDGPSGQVEFTEVEGGVEVRYNLAGLPGVGRLGFHVHENGDCGPGPDGEPGGAAGDHFNPMASPHGAPDHAAAARHAGDLGNVTAGADGRAVGSRIDSVLAFSGPTSMLGKAVVLHAEADDYETQPGGDAGARIACGIVERR